MATGMQMEASPTKLPEQPMASALGGPRFGPPELSPRCIHVQEAKTHLSALLARVVAY